MNKFCNTTRLIVLVLLAFVSISTVQAQPEPEIVFDSMFGQQEPRTRWLPPDGFTSPTGVAFTSNDKIVVADKGNNQIQFCDLQGVCVWLGADSIFFRNQAGIFDKPHGIDADQNGRFAVADEDNHAVQSCTLDGACTYSGKTTSQENPPASSLGRWAFPDDVAFDSLGRVYGLDTGNNRVQVLDAGTLNFRDQFGGDGNGLGKFNAAKGISIDNQDMVYIADTGNNRIQICDSKGNNCSAFGSSGTAPGQFDRPSGIEVDHRGFIWVADTGNNRVQVCDKQGACTAFGSFGTDAGQFDEPFDVAVSPAGLLAVVDTNNHRIQFFSTGEFVMNPGLNDAWYDPLTDGQGFFVTVFPEKGTVLVAWFTYDTELPSEDAQSNLGDAGHRWLTALGTFVGNTAVLNVDNTSDGLFDSPRPIIHTPYGTMILTFEDCVSGTVEYDFPSINRQGTVPIQRVAGDNIALCRALRQ